MKKTILKTAVFVLVFAISTVAFSYFMNLGNENMTMDMSPAGLPVITMEKDGIAYNQLHGYREAMDPAYQRETVTELGAGREIDFTIDTYGAEIDKVSVEVRSVDGARLVESSEVTELTAGGEQQLYGSLTLKDLLEKDKEYMLVLLLDMQEETIRYYTRILWSEDTYALEKLSFVRDFHAILYDREAAKEQNITKYLESNSSGDNTTYHKVNIHSSFQQITWGDLNVTEETEPVMQLTDLGTQNGSIVLHYIVSTTTNEDTKSYYLVEEAYRVRFLTNAERLYLLEFDRTMTQIPDVHSDMYENDKILLGIVDENLPIYESEDGNIVVFVLAGKLLSYHTDTGRITTIFSFYDKENADSRTLYDAHTIKPLDVDEDGNVYFVVGGYMNRGHHEGEVGAAVYYYNASQNTIEEIVYIPTDKSPEVLMEELEQLAYFNREGLFYLYLDQTVFAVDTINKTYESVVTITPDKRMMTSENRRILAWNAGSASEEGSSLSIRNLSTGKENVIHASAGTAIRLLGFMGEDIIYGVARTEDVETDSAGNVFFPMYQICIYDTEEALFEKETQEGIYMTECTVEGNQIILQRVEKKVNGSYDSIDPDYIMMNEEVKHGENQLVTVNIDVYKKYVQLQVSEEINEKKLQVRSPKEVMFEGSRELELIAEEAVERYYVYDATGIHRITTNPAEAVRVAYDCSGAVTDERGMQIYRRGNLVARNQIMAIKAAEADENRSSLAVCLDALFAQAGVAMNSQAFLDQGLSYAELLEQELPDAQILNLKGVPLDAVYYYLNQDIPVLAMLEDGEAVLLTGFNELQTVILEPSTGKLYKKSKKETAQWLEENGNCFMTYVID